MMKPCSVTTMSRVKAGISKPTSAPPWNSAPKRRLARKDADRMVAAHHRDPRSGEACRRRRNPAALAVHAGDLVHAHEHGERAEIASRSSLVRGAEPA